MQTLHNIHYTDATVTLRYTAHWFVLVQSVANSLTGSREHNMTSCLQVNEHDNRVCCN